MAVVQQLRPAAAEPSGDPDRVNVVRLVDFLGPISPELVLVDPELAPRARALLPELPWNWQPGTREGNEPIPLRVVGVPAPAPSSRWRLATVSALAAATAASFGLGVSVAASDESKSTAVGSRPPLATPIVPPVKTEPAPARPAPKPSPKPQRPVPAPPRFVWPAVGRAKAYRFALYRGGRQVFEKDVTSTGFQLQQSWTYQGRFYGLEKGAYRWVVWPLLGAAKRQGPAIVSAQYAV